MSINSNDELFISSPAVGVLRSDQTIENWQQFNTGLSAASIRATLIAGDETIYAGTQGTGIFRSNDSGDSWEQINSGLTTVFVSSLASNSQGYIFARTSSGIFRLKDGSQTWEQINDFTDSSIGEITIDDTDGIYIIVNGQNVFYSVSNGDSWIDKTNELNNLGLRALAIDSANSIYVGTFLKGIYKSIDNGNSWFAVGLDSTLVKDIFITQNDIIYVGTSRILSHIKTVLFDQKMEDSLGNHLIMTCLMRQFHPLQRVWMEPFWQPPRTEFIAFLLMEVIGLPKIEV